MAMISMIDFESDFKKSILILSLFIPLQSYNFCLKYFYYDDSSMTSISFYADYVDFLGCDNEDICSKS